MYTMCILYESALAAVVSSRIISSRPRASVVQDNERER